MKTFSRFLISCLSILCLAIQFTASGQESVIMQHHDVNRTGWFNKETSLNINNVKAGFFGKLFERTVDDQVYAQPLVLARVALPGIGTKNLLITATVSNTIYAFDADSANVTNPYWQVSLTAPNSRAVKNTDMTGACGGGYRDFSGNMGIVGTPAIDTVTNTIYVVARSLNTTTGVFTQYLHALDAKTGAEKFSGPKLISGSVNGNGDGSVNGKVNFDPQKNNQRPGLLLANGNVYIAWSSHCDWGPYHGWVIGYDQTTLAQTSIYCTTPDGYFGGIWMSGAGPSLDENGNLYIAVGNGSVGLNGDRTNLANRSESAIKLNTTGNSLSVASYFTPNNVDELEAGDLDFGVTQVLLIPNTTQAMTSCKDGHVFLLDRDNMGGYNGASNNVLQDIDLGGSAHLRSALSYYRGGTNEFVYCWSENALLKAFPYSRTTNKFDLANTISSGVQGPAGNNGAVLSVSSNASIDSTAILWTSYAANGDANQSVRPGVLRAFDANDITKEIWNTTIIPTDNPGTYAKFNCPVIANGKVYLGTFSNKVVVYGLKAGPVNNTCNSGNIALNKTAIASGTTDPTNFPASAATDGNINTKWNSPVIHPQYIYVDLAGRYDICKIVLKWENAVARTFTLQSSDNALNWTTLASIPSNNVTVNEVPITATGRYVRFLGTEGGDPTGYALQEFEVYGVLSANQCPKPVLLNVADIYETSSTLHWITNGASNFDVQYKTVLGSTWNSVVADSNFVQLTNLACGTDYLYRIRKVCSAGDTSDYSTTGAFSTLSCNSNCGPLPTRWTSQDIGNTGVAGSACYSNSTYTLSGSGTDIWDIEDAFRYAYKTFVGDGEMVARVASMDLSNPWNKGGIMFRESLAPGSRHAFLALTSGNGAAFQYRDFTDGASSNTNTGPGLHPPYWVKLVKAGSVYSAFISPDGITWAVIGAPVNLGFGVDVPIYAGLALSSHQNDLLSVATIDHFSLTDNLTQFNLQSFTGSLNLDKTVALEWVTTREANINNFIIERSSDMNHFVAIDSVDAENGGDFTKVYDESDQHPLGVNYYRLRINMADGSFTYSAIVFIRITDAKAPLLYPNPARSEFHIAKGTETIQMVNIYDITGRFLRTISNDNSDPGLTIPVSSFANGVYIIEIRTAQSVYREKLVVSN